LTRVLEKLSLVAFRGARGLILDGLTGVNLVVGHNNIGKSSILEAAAILLRPSDPGQWVSVARHRDVDIAVVDGLWGLFPGGTAIQFEDGPGEPRSIRLDGVLAGKPRTVDVDGSALQGGWAADAETDVTLRLELRLDGAAPHTMEFHNRRTLAVPWANGVVAHRAFTITPATHRSTRTMLDHLSGVVEVGRKPLALELLRLFDPDVEDLEETSPLGRRTIRVTHGKRGIVDLSSFGDGMRRAAALAMALARAHDGVLLVDEIETGIHHRALGDVLTKLIEAATASNVQIIATTHSLEAVDATIEASERAGAMGALSAYYLQRHGDQCEARRYDHKQLARFREGGLDIR
jgi:energy-coupling factor transporter ATP-binding protein EcfA2